MFNDHVLPLHLLSQLSITFGNHVLFSDISLFQNLTMLILRLSQLVVLPMSPFIASIGVCVVSQTIYTFVFVYN